MRKLTIAQLREKALERFNNDYINDMTKAANLVNRFYRLSAMEDRLLYLTNDESTHNARYTIELSEKATKSLDRLREDLKAYGLTIRYYSWLPTLEEIGTQREALTRWYY